MNKYGSYEKTQEGKGGREGEQVNEREEDDVHVIYKELWIIKKHTVHASYCSLSFAVVFLQFIQRSLSKFL